MRRFMAKPGRVFEAKPRPKAIHRSLYRKDLRWVWRIVDFGAFVTIPPGKGGQRYISQIATRISGPRAAGSARK